MNSLARKSTVYSIVIALYAFAFCVLLSGCAGAASVLNEIIAVAGVLAASAASVFTLVGSLTGDPAEAAVGTLITSWANKIVAGLQNIESLFQQYQTTPNESLLSKIEAAISLGLSDVASFSSIEGIPANIATDISAWGQEIATQLEAWAAVVAGWNTSTASTAPTASIAEKAHAIGSLERFTAALTPVQQAQFAKLKSAKQVEADLKKIFPKAA